MVGSTARRPAAHRVWADGSLGEAAGRANDGVSASSTSGNGNTGRGGTDSLRMRVGQSVQPSVTDIYKEIHVQGKTVNAVLQELVPLTTAFTGVLDQWDAADDDDLDQDYD